MTIHSTRAVSFELKDVTFNYPRLAKAWTPRFENNVDGPQFSLQVKDLSADDVEILEELGVSLVENEDGKALNLKAYVTNARGEANEFCVFDSELNELSVEERERIGYGSKGHVIGYLYNNSHGGVSMRMTDVVVTELVEREEMSRADRIKARLSR